MTKHEQVANIIAFLVIMFGENSQVWEEIMNHNPDYIIEKFERYILSTKIEYPRGMHPNLKDIRFQCYIDKWKLEFNEYE